MKQKTYILMTALILVLTPMVLAQADPKSTGGLDMVYLLVENTFGGVLITAVGMIVIFVVLGFFSRMSPILIMYFCILFGATFAIGYVGGAAALPIGIFCIYYFWNGLKNWINAGGGS